MSENQLTCLFPPPQYTYYTLSAFSIRVPMAVKRTLTTMQITQFIVGVFYAVIHSFVVYTVPVATTVVKTRAAEAAPTAVASALDATASETAPAFLDNLKQLVFGAASKVTSAAATANEASTAEANAAPQFTTVEETVYEPKVVPCIDTTGQTFAIWLNVLYLAPLTYLFVKFFITSYLRRAGAESARKDKGNRESQLTSAEKAGWDAARDLEAEVYGTPEPARTAGKSANGTPNGKVNGSPNGKAANGSANGRPSRSVASQRSRHA